MDRHIAAFPAIADADLMLCPAHGIAYQADMSEKVHYNGAYFDKYVGYEGAPIARAINAGRVGLVDKHVGAAAPVLDIGIGSGEFIKNRPTTFGYDVNPKAIDWLKQTRRWSDGFAAFEGFTFWDVLEHVENPDDDYFRRIHPGAFLFTSVPVFTDLTRIRESKHYRPGEHLYYFTEAGLIDWLHHYGFDLVERTDFETRAGREDILSFAFRRA
jgi:hypothetical protein